MKHCAKCLINLPLDNFRNNRTICKDCEQRLKREYYKLIKNGEIIVKKRESSIIINSSMVTRTCTKCKLIKKLSEFPCNVQNPSKWHHWKSYCKECCREFQRNRVKEGYKRPSSKSLLYNLFHRTMTKEGCSIELAKKVITIQSISGELRCLHTNIILSKNNHPLLQPSVDRIDSNLGYISGNIQIVPRFYNYAKGNFNDIEFRSIIKNPIVNTLDIQNAIEHAWKLANRHDKLSDLSFDQIRQLVNKQTINNITRCKITGLPLLDIWEHPQSLSIDRINNQLNYTIDNIQLTTLLYNRGKNKYNDQEAIIAFNTIKEGITQNAAEILILPFDYQINPKSYNYDLIIFEDEWINKTEIIKSIIDNKNKTIKSIISIRPQKLSIELINKNKADDFYNKYHYIGKCNSKYHIGAYFNNSLIAIMSIRAPSRQNAGDWEISRMARNPLYKVYGLWSYIFNWVKQNRLITGKIISYSDNRLFNGKVYQNMGFKEETTINRDYCWAKDGIRYHKSNLRKTNQEKQTGLTETELRIAQGYMKVWDIGKIKWIYNI